MKINNQEKRHVALLISVTKQKYKNADGKKNKNRSKDFQRKNILIN